MEILDGKIVSLEIQRQVKAEIAALDSFTGRAPGLTVMLVGDDPASQIYVKSKDKMAARLGVDSRVVRFSADVSADDLIQELAELNRDQTVDGILVQLPLPKKFDTWAILDHLSPDKDADCLHPISLGKLMLNRSNIYPCTPGGIMKMLDYYSIDLDGKNVVVVGRSFIVGKPMAAMLSNRNATVTLCHSRTRDLPSVVRNADLVVAAIGRPGFITADMVKPGAILVDVGINRLETEAEVAEFCTAEQKEKFTEKGYGIAGDIHKNAYEKSSYYTPVPGGVGLMTVAMLMYNTLQLYKNKVKKK